MPMRAESQGDVQVFKISNRMSIKMPKAPTRPGYDFMGWEFVRYDKNGKVNEFFQKKYKLPELYAYGNEVVSDLHLRAIWVKNPGQDITKIKPLPSTGVMEPTEGHFLFGNIETNATALTVKHAETVAPSIFRRTPYAPIDRPVWLALDQVSEGKRIA